MLYQTEELLKKEIKQSLEKEKWIVKREVPRKDCIGWTHPYAADFIIKHNFYYPQLGWIGLEVKNKVFDEFKQFTKGLRQVLSKYQNNYFQGIETPVNIWGVITDSPYQSNWNLPIKNFYTRFGVGLCNWNTSKNELSFAHTSQLSIFFSRQEMPKTNIDLFKAFIENKTSWVNHINKSNIGNPKWVK